LQRLEDRTLPAGINLLVSRAEPSLFADAAGGRLDPNQIGGGRIGHAASADGRYVAFSSIAANVIPGQVDANGGQDVFLHDRLFNSTILVSRATGTTTTAGNSRSSQPNISADGRYVAFFSDASDLVAGMLTPNLGNVFLFDRLTGSNTLVSHRHDAALTGSSSRSHSPLISADGQVVAFLSYATDLVPPPISDPADTGPQHAYVYDGVTGQVTLIDHKYGLPNTPSSEPQQSIGDISADGRHITFTSGLDVGPPGLGFRTAYRHDRLTGENLSIGPPGVIPNAVTSAGSLSGDGRWATFVSSATNLVPEYLGAATQIYLFDAATNAVALISHAQAGPANGGNASSGPGVISENGRFTAFLSRATDLIASYVDGNASNASDVFLFDRLTGQTTLVNRKAGTTATSDNSISTALSLSVSDNGAVVFASRATNLVAEFADTNGHGYDLYRFDPDAATVTLLSGKHGSPTVGGSGSTDSADMTSDGGTVVFHSTAGDLVAGLLDNNNAEDVYVRDAATSAVTLASRRFGPPTLSGGGESTWVQQSADGRYVVFTSTASNLVPGQVDLPASQDVFLFDRVAGTATLVTHQHDAPATSAAGAFAGEMGGATPVISRDGRFVAYTAYSTGLVAGFVDGNGAGPTQTSDGSDVYLFDRLTGVNTLVSRKAGTTTAGGNRGSGVYSGFGTLLSISDDGRFVAFASQATDLVAGFVDGNGVGGDAASPGTDVFVYDHLTGAVELVSHRPGLATTTGNAFSMAPSLSGDGRFVAFWGDAGNLVPGQTGGGGVFLYDRQTAAMALVSHRFDSPTAASNGGSDAPAISRDGNFVVFQSASNNLIAGQVDANNRDDVFLYDRATGVNTLVSHAHNSPTAAGDWFSDLSSYGSNAGRLSDDGRFVVFYSGATTLVPGFFDANGVDTLGSGSGDVYLFDRLSGANTLVSRWAGPGNRTGNAASSRPVLSGDGRVVAFHSIAFDLTTPPGYGTLFAFDRLTGATRRISHAVGDPNAAGNGTNFMLANNGDGSAIGYVSTSSNLVPGDSNGFADVFLYVTPPPRVQSVTIADGSAQRSVIRSLRVDFDQPVFFAGEPAAAFVLTGQVGSVQLAAGSVSGNSVTLTFSGMQTQFGSLIDGKYTLRVLADQISNIGPLDGNNDGVGGDDFTFNFHRLFGDADGNGFVDAWDFRAFRAALGSAAFVFDFDGDGDVDAADFVAFRGRFGVAV
jgi:Tol biopolymer transport system component